MSALATFILISIGVVLCTGANDSPQLPVYTYAEVRNHAGVLSWTISQTDDIDGIKSSPVVTKVIPKNGWIIQQTTATDAIPDIVSAYLVGITDQKSLGPYPEAHFSNTLKNICANPKANKDCANLTIFLQKQLDKTLDIALSAKNDVDHQLLLSLWQLKGMSDAAMNTSAVFSKQLTDDFLRSLRNQVLNAPYFLSVFDDISEIANLNGFESLWKYIQAYEIKGQAILKTTNTEGKPNLILAHITHTNYANFLRVLKSFDLKWYQHFGSNKGELLPGAKMVFTSYPNSFTSLDHMYNTKNMVFMQSAIGDQFNRVRPVIKKSKLGKSDNLTRLVETIPTAFRVMIANRLARSSRDWEVKFRTHPFYITAGSWMIVDKRKFVRQGDFGRILFGGFRLMESYRDTPYSMDLSAVLSKRTLWAQVGIPFNVNVAEELGYNDMKSLFGNYFSYKKNPIAQIIQRDIPMNVTRGNFYAALRQNNYKLDKLSSCACKPPYSAALSPAARSDANPQNGYFQNLPWLDFRFVGAIDYKQVELINPDRFIVQSSVPAATIKLFQWSSFDLKPPKLQPDMLDNRFLFYKMYL